MPRTPEIPGSPRNVTISIKMTEAGAEELDRLRAKRGPDVSRAEYLRDLLKRDSVAERQAAMRTRITTRKP